MNRGSSRSTASATSRLNKLNPIFHKTSKSEDDKVVNPVLLQQAKHSGKLILTSRNLTSADVLLLGEVHSNDDNVELNRKEGGSWWEMEPLVYLDMSSNTISSLPSAINQLDSLTTLLLNDNNLKCVPPELGHLFKLTKLDLGRNSLSDLPDELSALKELKWLNISMNELSSVPDCIFNLVMLQNLDVRKNKITRMESGMGFLVRLTHLNLSNNKLQSIPPDISNCKALVDLDLSCNELTSEGLPPLGDLHAVQILQISNNQLTLLPRLHGCFNLKEIHLGYNKMKEITIDELSTLSHLQVIVLRDNQLEKLPREMSCMQNLIRLDLTNNNLTELPATLGLLPHLQNLLVEGNSLRSIRRDVISGGTQRLLKHLKQTLPLSEEDMALVTNLPCQSGDALPDRFTMRSSRALNLAGRDLCNIPASVFDEALEVPCAIVDLSKNRLTEVPASMWKLGTNITDLNLSCNQLKELSSAIQNCTNLTFLCLGNNSLTTLPEGLRECQRLREVNIACNMFPEVPDCLYKIIGLEIIIARDNKITSINVDGLKNIKYLSTLDLANNSISNVPPQLGQMTQIKSLELDGNGLRVPRPAVLAKGTEAVMSWLRDKIPA